MHDRCIQRLDRRALEEGWPLPRMEAWTRAPRFEAERDGEGEVPEEETALEESDQLEGVGKLVRPPDGEGSVRERERPHHDPGALQC